MKRILAIIGTNFRRTMRDRIGLFFILLFPMILILLLGLAFGGGFTPKLGVVTPGGDLADALIDRLEASDDLEVEVVESRSELENGVQRELLQAGVIIPEGYDEAVRSGSGAQVGYLAQQGEFSAALRSTVVSAVSEEAAIARAAHVAEEVGATDLDGGFETARQMSGIDPAVTVEAQSVGEASEFEGLGTFDAGASTMLILFIFVNSLAASVALIQTRQLGISRRMLSTPTSARQILLGEAGGRFAFAMFQGVFIILASGFVFGVKWGDPVAAAAIVTLFALVSTGAAMFFGAILKNEQQAGALTPLGLGLAALGGCMVPLEVFSPTMQNVAHITPHAWAVEGFTDLIRNDAGIGDVLPQLGALAGFAVVLLGLASWRLSKAITG